MSDPVNNVPQEVMFESIPLSDMTDFENDIGILLIVKDGEHCAPDDYDSLVPGSLLFSGGWIGLVISATPGRTRFGVMWSETTS